MLKFTLQMEMVFEVSEEFMDDETGKSFENAVLDGGIRIGTGEVKLLDPSGELLDIDMDEFGDIGSFMQEALLKKAKEEGAE
jgi:hypothetical protein